jgi:hypothetical protein
LIGCNLKQFGLAELGSASLYTRGSGAHETESRRDVADGPAAILLHLSCPVQNADRAVLIQLSFRRGRNHQQQAQRQQCALEGCDRCTNYHSHIHLRSLPASATMLFSLA